MTVLHEMSYILSFHAVFEIWYMGFICTIHLSLNKPQSKDSVAMQAAMLPYLVVNVSETPALISAQFSALFPDILLPRQILESRRKMLR